MGKLTALGESLDSMDQQADLPEIKNFAKELMSEFMDDATAGGAGTKSNDRFNALVANIAQKLQSGDIGGRGTEMVSNLVKEAVQAQILRKGGRGGEVENMNIPSDGKDGGKSRNTGAGPQRKNGPTGAHIESRGPRVCSRS